MQPRTRGAIRAERGQNILEFALVFPILLFFLFAMAELGILLNYRISINHALEEGARRVAVTGNEADAVAWTNDQSHGLIDAATVCYVDENSSGDADRGDSVRVDGSYTYEVLTLNGILGFLGSSAFPDTIELSTHGTSRLETDGDMSAC